MDGLAVLDGVAALAPAEQGAGIVVEVGRLGIQGGSLGTADGSEQVGLVTLPAAGEVDALGTVVADAVLALQEHHFVAVVQLRDTAHGGQQGHRQFHLGGIGAEGVTGTGVVVVGEERHHMAQVLIHEVLGQHSVDAGHALVPVHLLLIEGLVDGVLQREVHDGRQVGVEAVLVGVVLLPVGQLRDVVIPAFAHDVQVGILFQHGLAPLAHGFGLIVRIGVHAQTVQVGVFHPPDGPLLEILQDKGIVQVHIRHGRYEPAAFLTVTVGLGGVGIHIHGEQGVHLHVGLVHVIPVLEGRIVHPPVSRAAVVGDNVHDHLQAVLVAFGHKGLVQGVVSEAGVDVVVVGAGIAVVTLLRLVVQQQRGAPDGRSTQVRYIVQVIDDALQVSSVPGNRILAVHLVREERNGPRLFRPVVVRGDDVAEAFLVGGVGIGKAVRHDEVDHIGRGETLTLGTPLPALAQLIGVLEGLPFAGEDEIVRAGLGRCTHLHVHKEIVRAGSLVHVLHPESCSGDGNVTVRNIRSLYHQLQGCFHTHPPAKRFYTGNLIGRGVFQIGRIYGGGAAASGQSQGSHKRQKGFFHSLSG